jgi:hypothetical protein
MNNKQLRFGIAAILAGACLFVAAFLPNPTFVVPRGNCPPHCPQVALYHPHDACPPHCDGYYKSVKFGYVR